MGYVTDKLDKEVLKVQMNRIYNKLKEEYLYLYNENEDYYKDNLNKINNCIPPVENTKNYMINSKVTKNKVLKGFIFLSLKFLFKYLEIF